MTWYANRHLDSQFLRIAVAMLSSSRVTYPNRGYNRGHKLDVRNNEVNLSVPVTSMDYAGTYMFMARSSLPLPMIERFVQLTILGK